MTKGLIKYCICFILALGQALGQGRSNQILGKFEKYVAQEQAVKLILIGYNGKIPMNLDTVVVAQDGSFQLHYPNSYTGIGLMQIVGVQGEVPLVLIGNVPMEQNISFTNGSLSFSEGSPNDLYSSLKQKSTKSRRQLDLLSQLNKHYEPTSAFGQAIATEQKAAAVADQKFVTEINALNTDVGYFLRLEESLTMMNMLLSSNQQPPMEKLKAAQVYFEQVVSLNDERLWHTGFVHRLIYSYYALSSVVEGGHQHASDFLASRLAASPVKNTYLEEIIGVVQQQPAIAEYFSQKMLAVSEQCDDMPGNDMPGKIKRQLEQYSLLKIGNPAPDERLDNGKRISELPGAYKLIVFWASWCEHCQKEIPELRAMYADLKKQDIEVVAMGMDDNAQIHQLVSQLNPWVSHFVGRDWNAPISQHYRVFGTPTFFLVDKDMKIVARPKSVAEVSEWINRNKM